MNERIIPRLTQINLRELLESILPQNQAVVGHVIEHNFPVLGQRRMVLNARRFVSTLGNTVLILLAMVAVASPEASKKR